MSHLLQVARTSLSAAAAMLLPTTLCAQYVWPASASGQSGNAVLNAPFTTLAGQPTNATRLMVIFEAGSLPFPIGTAISQIALRRDVAYSGQSYAGFSGTLLARMGRALVPPAQVQDVRFARLWDGAPATVLSTSSFTVPAAAPGGAPPPFSVVIPFTRPFTWQGGPLAIDLVFTASSVPTTFRLDGSASQAPVTGSFQSVGGGCAGSNGFTPYHYALPETTMPGSVLKFELAGARLASNPSALENFCFHLLGLQNVTYQGLPLPLSLGSYGAPASCQLRIDPIANMLVFMNNPSAMFARATNTSALPPAAWLVGAPIYSQWICFDTALNTPLPVTVSDAQRVVLGQVAPPPPPNAVRCIWKYGATGFDIDSGRMVLHDYGPAIRFQ
jgi:hypothetical protein